jgi:hypothetical protein
MKRHVAFASLLLVAACRTPAPPPPSASGDHLTLAERLAEEAASRSAAAPRAEEVAAALGRAGVSVRSFQQVLARTVRARFCMAGHTDAGLAVSVCEFADDAAAAGGADYSRRTFDRLVPNRRLERKGPTLLTLTRAATGPAVDGEVARAATAFASL